MYEINKDRTRVMMAINCFANMCGYFFNANFDDGCDICPNNGYNCRHPECEEKFDGIGCCFSWGCPFGRPADEEDCLEFGWDYEENEFIVIDNSEIIAKLN